MPTFTNQAILTYGDNRTALSNIAVGNLAEPISITKTAVNDTYVSNDEITYIVTITNLSPSPLTNLILTDDLGEYTFGALTLHPLTFVGDPILYYINGVPQADLTPTQTVPTLVFTVPSVPANGNVTLVYKVQVNQYAPLGVGDSIVNEVTVSDLMDISATATIEAEETPQLAITKSISPDPVLDNQTATYTFIINNYGNTASDDVELTDTFDPVLSNVTVTVDGTPLVLDEDYTYESGVLTILSGHLTVPPATFSQDPDTGVVTATPGFVTVVVTGIV